MTSTFAKNVVVFVCTVLAVLATSNPEARPASRASAAELREIPITATRFAFEPSRVEVMEGETVRLIVSSADGVHGIGIKKFKVSKVIPRGGKPVVIEFTATAPGEYEIVCSEYCGEGHEKMKGVLVVSARSGA